jgi:hypothetical protein
VTAADFFEAHYRFLRWCASRISWCRSHGASLIDDWRVASRCALGVAWSVEINGMF